MRLGRARRRRAPEVDALWELAQIRRQLEVRTTEAIEMLDESGGAEEAPPLEPEDRGWALGFIDELESTAGDVEHELAAALGRWLARRGHG